MFSRIQLIIVAILVVFAACICTFAPDVFGSQDAGPEATEGIGTSPEASPADTLSGAAPVAVAPVAASDSILELAGDLYRAVTGGEASGWVIASLSLMLLIGLGRRLARSDWTGKAGDWLERVMYGGTDLRGSISTMLISMLGAMATSLLGGYGAPDLELLAFGWGVGVAAVMGYSGLWKRVGLPLLNLVPYIKDFVPDPPDAKKLAAA